jgi:uncharacterized membrane protein YkoI
MTGPGLRTAVALLSLWTAAAPALDRLPDADKNADDHELARRLHEQGTIVSLESVMAKAQEIRPGDLLEVELKKKRASYVYEVEILDSTGQVWDLKFEARDGRLIKEEQENK